jgi:hypothetical protein
MKRRTVEIIVETDELLVVNKQSRHVTLKCQACGAPLDPLVLATRAVSPHPDAYDLSSSDISFRHEEDENAAQENQQVDASRRPVAT